MHFLIYGAGALGQALGGMLAASGHKVDLVLRKRFIDVVQEKGLLVTGIFGEFAAPSENLVLRETITGIDGASYDYVLLTTKAYDTAKSVLDISSMLNCDCPVVSMQNGCGNIEKLIAEFGENRSFGARVITGFEISQPGEVKITVSADDVHVGWCRKGVEKEESVKLAEAISDSGLPCVVADDIYKSLYAKLLYNCALNPLGAVLGVHYGLLGERPETRKIMDSVISETFNIVRAIGGTTPWQNADEYREIFYSTLLPATYNHRPSMLQDIEGGKPTEVEALIGYVAAQGEKYGVATPTCAMLAGLVRFKEKQKKE